MTWFIALRMCAKKLQQGCTFLRLPKRDRNGSWLITFLSLPGVDRPNVAHYMLRTTLHKEISGKAMRQAQQYPVAFLIYIVNYIERVNVSFATSE